MRIEIDKLIPLDESYVKAIELSKLTHSRIGFQLLVENQQSSELIPDVLIELYDRSGNVIVAVHTLDPDSQTPIAPGSSRRIVGRFDGAYGNAAFFRVSAN